MSKHSHITPSDFIMVYGEDFLERTSRDELLKLVSVAFDYDGTPVSFWACCPSDGIMRNVTADLAVEWFEEGGFAWGSIPDAFRPHLDDQMHDYQRAREEALRDVVSPWRRFA